MQKRHGCRLTYLLKKSSATNQCDCGPPASRTSSALSVLIQWALVEGWAWQPADNKLNLGLSPLLLLLLIINIYITLPPGGIPLFIVIDDAVVFCFVVLLLSYYLFWF
jgi:hypothetical protein